MLRICVSISGGWSPTGTRVIPGRSTNVIVSTFGEQIFNRICLSLTPLFTPVVRSVSASISSRIASKSVNISPGRCKNSPHSVGPSRAAGVCTSCNSNGRRVQISGPRGRKSRPTCACITHVQNVSPIVHGRRTPRASRIAPGVSSCSPSLAFARHRRPAPTPTRA